MRLNHLSLTIITAALAACSSGDQADFADSAATGENVTAAALAIDTAQLLGHIKDLSADSMEGRGPGTAGEVKTVAYLTEQFKAMGLAPGNPDGSYTQDVDLIGYTSKPSATVTSGGKSISMRFPDDYVAGSRHDQPTTNVDDSGIIFVGYGVVAPEYNWNDYKNVDVKGKTILMLVNDPPVRSSSDTSQLDTAMFKGKAMTYYGRWTYKYEIATEKGAAAALVIHETGPAGYPYEVVRGSFSAEQFDVPSPDAEKRVPVEGWLTLDKTKEILRAAGLNFDSLKAAARTRDFTPVTLNATASFSVKNSVRRIQSKNVVAKLEGTDLKDEYVIYSAHWDHLGIDTTAKGDQIYNGALDNASGTSGLLEIAQAFTKLTPAPRRSVLFLAVTAEEKGLLGAKYYAEHPLYPLDHTVADINIDGVNQWGRTKDLTVVGMGNSTLEDVLGRVMHADGRVLRPDPEPEKGFFYRSDHFEFAKLGVPALYLDAGIEFVGKPDEYGMSKREEYTANDYHKPSDVVKSDWDLSGAAEDLRALFRTGYIVAQSSEIPEWREGTEFKAKRDSAMAARE